MWFYYNLQDDSSKKHWRGCSTKKTCSKCSPLPTSAAALSYTGADSDSLTEVWTAFSYIFMCSNREGDRQLSITECHMVKNILECYLMIFFFLNHMCWNNFLGPRWGTLPGATSANWNWDDFPVRINAPFNCKQNIQATSLQTPSHPWAFSSQTPNKFDYVAPANQIFSIFLFLALDSWPY